MSLKLNPSKLLPSAKTTSLAKTNKSSLSIKEKKINLSSSIKSIEIKPIAIKPFEINSTKDVNNKLLKIDKIFKSDFLKSQKKSEKKRKENEKEDFDKAENRLELPKLKGFQLPKLPKLPSFGFLDAIKRFLFFTALGWLLPKILEFLPKLEGIVKIIGGVYQFAEGLFGKLFDGFMSLVKFGGDLKDKTIGFIAQATGGDAKNFQEKFDKLEKLFNTYVNASIVAGLVGLDIGLAAVDEYNKQKNKNAKPVKPGVKAGVKAGVKVTKGRGGKKPTGKPKVTGEKPPSWWNKIFKGPFAKLKGPLSKFAGSVVPGVGAVVGAADAAARFSAGDKIGGTLASISATLDALAAGSAILALTGIGAVVPAAFGTVSMGIDVVLLIRDILKTFGVPIFNKGGRVVRKYQAGGTTRGGKSTNAPVKRTIKPAVGKRLLKLKPPKSQPGKDVGGEKKIREFYGKELSENDRYVRPAGGWLSTLGQKRMDERPYTAITTTAKILKDIPLLGGIMGASVDIALGQKPDVNVYRSLSAGIGSLVENLANQKANNSISSLTRDIKGFAEGGNVPASRELKGGYSSLSSGDMLAKVLGSTIDQRVNEAIQSIEKELQKMQEKKDGEKEPPQDLDTTPGTVKVTSDSPDFWLLVTAALFENGIPTDGYQGAADAAQAIYNRVSLPGWPKSIKDVILQPGQFQPVTDYGGVEEWKKINSKESAIAFAKKYKSYSGNIVEKIAATLLDRNKQENARTFVGPRDNFRSDAYEKSNNQLDDSTEKSRYGHTFGFEPRGANIGRFKKGKLMPAEINKEIVSGKVEQLEKPRQSGYKPSKPGSFNAIQYITGDPSQSTNYELKGHGLKSNYHDHIAFATIADKEKAKKALLKAGIKIGSEYRRGDPGYHGANLAIDIPGYQWHGSGEIGQKEYDGSKKVRSILGLQSGGLISPSKPNRQIPNKFASYEKYGSGAIVAIQPIIIEKQIPSSSTESIFSFPVLISVNNTNGIERYRG